MGVAHQCKSLRHYQKDLDPVIDVLNLDLVSYAGYAKRGLE